MSLYQYIPPRLNEHEVYPTRHRSIPIRDTFLNAAIALDGYERLKNERDETAIRLLNSISNASQLILDASSYLTKNEHFFSEWTKEEVEVDRKFDFIMIYKPIFPEVDIEKLRQIPVIAPIFAQKTRELSKKLTNPERLTKEERSNLVDKLIAISKSIQHEQYRANRFM